MYHFPEVFQQPKDEYMHAIIRSIIEDDKNQKVKVLNVYLANLHVSPLARMWNTNSLGSSKQVGTNKTTTNKLKDNEYKDFS
jgi:ABC-type dipeptide/oligopeptide/nickel transport system ATPase component